MNKVWCQPECRGRYFYTQCKGTCRCAGQGAGRKCGPELGPELGLSQGDQAKVPNSKLLCPEQIFK